MSLGEDARLSALDSVLDAQLAGGPVETLGADLFGVVDALDSSAALRRGLADPGTPESARRGLAHGVLDGKVSAAAVEVVAEAAVVRWTGPRTFVAAIERQALRAQLAKADAAGELEDTEDELFRFARLVSSNPALREAVGDRAVPVDRRQDLVSDLLTGRATEATVVLARRAVLARERTFDHTLESYVNLAAEQKNRLVATVRVARPLTDAQVERMKAALARQAGRPVFIQVLLDPRVLGGMRVEFGDEVIEGTVAAKLEEARRLFS
jgi:F-type H+-transporting ATPase subunit delta